MKKILALVSVAALTLAGCTTTGGQVDWRAALAKSCSTAQPFVDVLTVLDEGGSLSPQNSARFARAKLTYAEVCDGSVTDLPSAVAKAASLYVLLVSIKKSEG